MNNIQQLIQQLCPNGVEYKRLGEVCEIVPARKKIKTHAYLSSGKYPVIDQGQKFIGGYTDEEEGVIDRDEYVIFGDHTCIVKFVDFMFFPGADGVKILSANRKIITPKFMYYCMCNIHMESSYSRHWAKVNKEVIPLPPLPVQRAIAAVLDRFTELETELETELQCRKKQYEYYRDSLLNFDNDNVQWVKLGDIGTFTRGNGLQKKDFTPTGVGCIHYGQIHTHYGTATTETISCCSPDLARKLRKAHKGDLIIATTSEDVKDVCKAVVWLGDEEIVVGGDACIFSHNQNPKYIAYYFQTHAFYDFKKKKAKGTKVIRVSKEDMAEFLIPLPSLSVQRRIVGILDRFEALTTSISEGLPAEIDARRRQYEYYRDRLLTFKRKEQ